MTGVANTIFEPLARLKWGIIPIRRKVDDDIEDTQESSYDEKEGGVPQGTTLEYRDEAKRPWTKLFDEYEYRKNIYERKAHKWYKWFDENDKPAERKLMWKIDIILTLYSMAAYFSKYLAQQNLTNVYVQDDFKRDIGMGGNDLVNTQAIFNIGNIVLQIPFAYALYALPLTYILPALDISWAILTIGASQISSVGQLKALRFLIGCCEAPSYLAYQFLFGTWIYDPAMMTRRSCVYYTGQYLGILCSSVLSGSIIRHFDGVNGYHAWRWVFIWDGIISIIIGVIGLYMIPGTPTDCYSIWLTDDEIRLVRNRLKKNHTAGRDKTNSLRSFFSIKLWKNILLSWEFYFLSFWNGLGWNTNNGSSGAYVLWLKSTGWYSEAKVQDMSAITPGLGILWLILIALWADMLEQRFASIFGAQVINLVGNIILAVWNVPVGAKWFAWMIQYFCWAESPPFFSACNDILRRDMRKRAVVMVWLNMFGQAAYTWMSVIMWKTVEEPRYLHGFTWTACSAFSFAMLCPVAMFLYKRQEKKFALQNGIVLYNSKYESCPSISLSHEDSDSGKIEWKAPKVAVSPAN